MHTILIHELFIIEIVCIISLALILHILYSGYNYYYIFRRKKKKDLQGITMLATPHMYQTTPTHDYLH